MGKQHLRRLRHVLRRVETLDRTCCAGRRLVRSTGSRGIRRFHSSLRLRQHGRTRISTCGDLSNRTLYESFFKWREVPINKLPSDFVKHVVNAENPWCALCQKLRNIRHCWIIVRDECMWKIDANKDKTIVVGFNLIFKYLFPFRVLLLCLLKFVFDPPSSVSFAIGSVSLVEILYLCERECEWVLVFECDELR